jgi:hypothetical protein
VIYEPDRILCLFASRPARITRLEPRWRFPQSVEDRAELNDTNATPHGDFSKEVRMSILTATPVEQIEERHLIALIENKVPESRDLDFKRDPIGRDDKAKREFLKDVTAFANTAGGHLVIGIQEADGIADTMIGIQSPSADEEVRRLDQIIQSGIEPRLVGLRIHPVSLRAGGYALVLNIPVSWNPPHRVVFGGWNRFFARNSAGAYELSVEQLRAVFLGGAELEHRLMDFRVERLARLEAGERGPALNGHGKLLIQAVPVARGEAADLSICQRDLGAYIPPRTHGDFNYRYNLDGFLIDSGSFDGQPPRAYTQVFRDRRIEIATGGYCFPNANAQDRQKTTAGQSLGTDLYQGIERAVQASVRLGAALPIAVMVSFIGAQGTVMITSPDSPGWHLKPLDRSTLLLDTVIVETLASKAPWQNVLRPLFDSLWNAFGYERCKDLFDDQGRWLGIPAGWQ